MLRIEILAVLLALLLSLIYPELGSGFFAKIESLFSRLAKRRTLCVLLIATLALALRAAVLPILPVPRPALNDEFSYALMADTFAHGRVTNPTHPLWVHFESIFVIHQPTYCSMYYPASGLFLGLSQIVTHDQFWGVWLSVGLMCGAICWMLQAWVPPFWAFIGGFLAVVRIGIFSYWANSYWGGAVTALGGALVLGALPRIRKRQKARDALLMGVGFMLLFGSRPYEALFFSLPVSWALLVWAFHAEHSSGASIARPAAVLLIMLTATGALLAFYFWRTTGNPFLPPYIVNLRTYAVSPNFAWLPLRKIPEYHHESLRLRWLGWDVEQYEVARHHPIFASVMKLMMLWFFYLGPLLSLPLILSFLTLPRGFSLRSVGFRSRFLLSVCASVLVGILLAVPIESHYAAAATPALYAVLVTAMARLRHRWVGRATTGIFLVRATVCAAVLLVVIRILIPICHLPIANSRVPDWSSSWVPVSARTDIEKQLDKLPGQQVVFVHYGPTHDPEQNWINNSADIDGSKIVWAHDMGGPFNNELIHNYPARRAWIVFPDEVPIRLAPYDGGQPESAGENQEGAEVER